MDRVIRQPDSVFRYRDFPELVWDAQPDAVIDVQDPVTLARLLTRGRAEVIGMLVPLTLLQDRLDELPLPENVRSFWLAVLRRDLPATSGAASLPEKA